MKLASIRSSECVLKPKDAMGKTVHDLADFTV